jgi:hypothetical protein
MKFTLHDQSKTTESESDWDTAVDLTTCTTVTNSLLLKTDGGAILHFWHESVLTSSEYLEPDFDKEEKTGEIGPNVWHKSTDSNRSTHKMGGGKSVSLALSELISVDEFKEFHSRTGEDVTDVDVKVHRFRQRCVSQDAVVEMDSMNDEFEAMKEGVFDHLFSKFVFSDTGIDATLVQQIFQAMPPNFAQAGGPLEFEVQLPAQIETNLLSMGARQQELLAKEDQVISENRAREARAKIDLAIDHMVHIQLHDMKSGWDKKRTSLSA